MALLSGPGKDWFNPVPTLKDKLAAEVAQKCPRVALMDGPGRDRLRGDLVLWSDGVIAGGKGSKNVRKMQLE